MASQVLKALLVIGAGCILSALFLADMPMTYILGIFMILLFVSLYAAKPMFFLGSLFFIRAGIDAFMVKVRFGFGGVDLGLAGAFSLLLTFLVLITFLVSQDKLAQHRVAHPLVLMYAAFCMYSVFNVFYALNLSDAIKVVVRNFATLAIMVLVILRVKDEDGAYFVLKAITASFIPCVLIGFITPGSMFKEIRGMRYCATLSHPNIFAFYLIVILACLLSRFYERKTDSKAQFFNFAGLVAIFAMLVLTRTRSGWIAAMILFAFYSWYHNRALIIPAIFVCIGLMFIPMVNQQILSLVEVRGDSIALNPDSSFYWRLEKWGFLLKEAIKKPLFGHGLGADSRIGNDTFPAHNDYMHFFVNTGVIGLLLYITPFFLLLRRASKTRSSTTNESLLNKISQFLLIYLPSFMIMSMSDNLYAYGIVQWYFWGIVGVYISLTWKQKHVHTAD